MRTTARLLLLQVRDRAVRLLLFFPMHISQVVAAVHMSGRAGAAGCFGAWLEDDMEGACADGFSRRVAHAAMLVS